MRSAGNFHPEWGYLAPAPSFMRTARIALVATAIGATAGIVVVVSLVDRPGSETDNTSIAAHALVISAPVITSPILPGADAPTATARATVAPTPPPPKAEAAANPPSPARNASAAVAPLPPTQVTLPPAATAEAPAPTSTPAAGASQPSPAAAPVHPNAIASAETPPTAPMAAPAASEPEGASASDETKKLAGKRHHPTNSAAARRWQYANDPRRRWRHDRGIGPLLHLFSFRLGSSSYTN